MKQKIVLISETLMYGVRKHIIDILKYINYNDFELHLIHSTDRTDTIFIDEIKLLKDKMTVYQVPSLVRELNAKKDISSFLTIYKMIAKIKPDIVHCHSSKAGAIGRVAAKLNKVKKIIYTPHGYVMQNNRIHITKRLLYISLERILLKYFTDKIIHVSKGEQQFAIDNRISSIQDSVIIFNGVRKEVKLDLAKLDILKEKYNVKDNVIIGTIGRISQEKAPFTFYEIARGILEKYKNVYFIYVGEGDLKDELLSRITEDKLEDRVILLGFSKEVNELLKLFNIYISTSLCEGLPYTLIEAIRVGLPTIATDVTGNNEIIIHNENGLLFEEDNVQEGIKSIDYLLKNRELWHEMEVKGNKLFIDKFTIENMMHKLESLYSNKLG